MKSFEIDARKSLRIILGALPGTNSSAIYVESGELPLALRFQQHSLQYFSRLQSNFPSHPLIQKFPTVPKVSFTDHINPRRSPLAIIKHWRTGLNKILYSSPKFAPTFPWILSTPSVYLECSSVVHRSNGPIITKAEALHTLSPDIRIHFTSTQMAHASLNSIEQLRLLPSLLFTSPKVHASRRSLASLRLNSLQSYWLSNFFQSSLLVKKSLFVLTPRQPYFLFKIICLDTPLTLASFPSFYRRSITYSFGVYQCPSNGSQLMWESPVMNSPTPSPKVL